MYSLRSMHILGSLSCAVIMKRNQISSLVLCEDNQNAHWHPYVWISFLTVATWQLYTRSEDEESTKPWRNHSRLLGVCEIRPERWCASLKERVRWNAVSKIIEGERGQRGLSHEQGQCLLPYAQCFMGIIFKAHKKSSVFFIFQKKRWGPEKFYGE